MKRFFYAFGFFCLLASLSGCLYGQCINGPCSLERKRMLNSIKPYSDYWVKDGMTQESRLRDWVDCGGQSNGNFSLDRSKRIPGESSETFRTRLEFDFQVCMIRHGYHYTGDCSSEYMRSRPLCGSR
ncbi:hypothetical protein DD235_16650 [Corticimicrobacter populi]|uniref:DUF2799 domain-containing protein n=1 Tax=Corticimicrobacter populi TaxID=2175229 RepID=A0A2V1JTA7_9BURK|nr:hypothetical protein DD235_16650 [Corticimicrobacter populi]